jgi:lipopolysaccharide transport system ATP-binding protein
MMSSGERLSISRTKKMNRMQLEQLLSVSQVSKRFDLYENPSHRLWDIFVPQKRPKRNEYWALKNINFSVGKGETVAIVGRNGSGKSTLLQLVCSTLHPTQGSIKVSGKIAALLELGSGFNLQFTGRENVYLYASILGMDYAQTQDIYPEIVRFADIGQFIDYPLNTYSSGMVVRLAFATAIHMLPDLLVIDEALAVGDTAFQQKCLNQIRKMQRSGISILLVTHSNNAVIEYCDRALYLRDGELLLDGSTREVVKQYSEDIVDEEKLQLSLQGQLTPEALVNHLPSNVRNVKAKSTLEILKVELVDIENKPTTVFQFGEKISILIHIVAQKTIDKPCSGIQLSSLDGIVLWSCTTEAIDQSFPALQIGASCIRWEVKANFSGNRYIVSLGLGEIVSGEYKRHHRLEHATHFDVLPEPQLGVGWLAPLPKFIPHGA